MAADVALAPRAPFDRALLLVVPAALFMVLLFIYPFVYGLLLSFEPAQGGADPPDAGRSDAVVAPAGLAVAEQLGGLQRPWDVPEESGRIHLRSLRFEAAE